MRARVRYIYEKLLEAVLIVLMVALAVEVTIGVVFRYVGYALVWYDEVATILLAWVTYYGSALAALKRAHLGVPEIVAMLPPKARLAVAVVAEGFVFAFFVVLAWVGYTVLEVLATDSLVSIPEVSVAFTQSVIPVSALLFILAEALVLPDVLREARSAKPVRVVADGLT
ncbi:MAG TPA: TRAP transporter small permease subunit [Burkholderiales bacterium]|nr:TRAP transporter small permease subunit [Burkholderiales bacterium]